MARQRSNGDVKTEKIFFYKNTIFESPDDENALIYNHLLNEGGESKILIDLSLTSRYYSDKYQFTVTRGGLPAILAEL